MAGLGLGVGIPVVVAFIVVTYCLCRQQGCCAYNKPAVIYGGPVYGVPMATGPLTVSYTQQPSALPSTVVIDVPAHAGAL